MEIRMTRSFIFLLFWQLALVGLVLGFQECKKSTLGSDYRGNVSVTTSGRTCQAWNTQSPHSHGFSSLDLFPDNTDEQRANYCRNPDEEDGPWCYTTDPSVRWEFCSIPDCWPYAECKRTEKGPEYRGSLSVTVSGRTCQPWSQTELHCKDGRCPDGGVFTSADENFCRNPDGDDLPWCYVGIQDREYCDVPYCKPSATCKSTDLGENYVGTVSETVDAIACQRWDEQFPHTHPYMDATSFPEESLGDAENYCRNPDGKSGGPWCYTTHPSVEFQYCDVPLCTDCKSSISGSEYSGTVYSTIFGLECQQWSAQTPHAHSYTDINRFPDNSLEDAGNYCRNPTGSERNLGPWCFTSDPAVEWDYCAIPSCDESTKPSVPMANHVLFIGIDGLKPSCIPDAPGGTPAFNRLAEEGIHTLTHGRTCLRTISGPAWTASLCGMDETDSGVTSNSWAPTWMGYNEDLSPVTGRDIMMPCVFHELKSRDANIRTAAFYDWDWFKYMTNKGYPGYVDHEMSFDNNFREDDELIKEGAVKYLRDNLVSAEKSFTFVYLGDVDGTGHSDGWCEEEYLASVDRADVRVGEILDVIDELGMQDQVLVILSADHGGLDYGHGRYADSDVLVPMYIRGPRVRTNAQFTRTVETKDIVPTAFYVLGLKPSSWWTGKIMQEAFEN